MHTEATQNVARHGNQSLDEQYHERFRKLLQRYCHHLLDPISILVIEVILDKRRALQFKEMRKLTHTVTTNNTSFQLPYFNDLIKDEEIERVLLELENLLILERFYAPPPPEKETLEMTYSQQQIALQQQQQQFQQKDRARASRYGQSTRKAQAAIPPETKREETFWGFSEDILRNLKSILEEIKRKAEQDYNQSRQQIWTCRSSQGEKYTADQLRGRGVSNPENNLNSNRCPIHNIILEHKKESTDSQQRCLYAVQLFNSLLRECTEISQACQAHNSILTFLDLYDPESSQDKYEQQLQEELLQQQLRKARVERRIEPQYSFIEDKELEDFFFEHIRNPLNSVQASTDGSQSDPVKQAEDLKNRFERIKDIISSHGLGDMRVLVQIPQLKFQSKHEPRIKKNIKLNTQ